MSAGTNSKPPFIPEFLARLGIKPGEWMNTSIPTVRVLVRPNQPRQIRIFGCLLLQAFGYNTDLAVAQSKFAKVAPMTPGGLASMLHRETVAAFKDAGIMLTDDQRAGMRKATAAHMRRDLADMEEQGILSRVRLNVSYEKLRRGPKAGDWKSLGEALEEELVTDFEDLSTEERQKCANGKVVLYLHARPRACKNLSVEDMTVEGMEFSGDGTVQFTRPDHITQILFNFTRALRRDPERAAELAARPDVRKEIESYERVVATAKGNLKEFLDHLVEPDSTLGSVASIGHCTKPKSNKPQDRISTDRNNYRGCSWHLR